MPYPYLSKNDKLSKAKALYGKFKWDEHLVFFGNDVTTLYKVYDEFTADEVMNFFRKAINGEIHLIDYKIGLFKNEEEVGDTYFVETSDDAAKEFTEKWLNETNSIEMAEADKYILYRGDEIVVINPL